MTTDFEQGDAATLTPSPGWQLMKVAGGVVLAWCLAAAVSGLLAVRGLPADPMGGFDAEFRAFSVLLPSSATVGYLEPFESAGSSDAVRMHYAAQYSLAPVVVVPRVGPEFVIVARGTARPEGDPRLDGYNEVAVVPAGHRLFQRVP